MSEKKGKDKNLSNDNCVDDGELSEQALVRREKLKKIINDDIDPYPVFFERKNLISKIREQFSDLEKEVKTGEVVSIAGRVMLNRNTGKLVFSTLREFGVDLQIMLTEDAIGKSELQRWKDFIDLGDLVGATGEVITTKRGELTIKVDSWVLVSKSLRPLPEKHKGLVDPEARIRQRYLDFILRPIAREMLEIRPKVTRAVREFFFKKDFLEVETPMLQLLHGGANARPFVTKSNAYDLPLYLRIAPELFLKRLLIGGVDKVFEVNRNFRNEGVDSSHNPEFTMLEFYEAYGDYNTSRILTQELIQYVCQEVYGTTVVQHTDDDGKVTEHDLGGEWRVVSVYDGLSNVFQERIDNETKKETLVSFAEAKEITLDPKWNRGQIVLELYEHLLEDTTVIPIFYTDFPIDVSPLTKEHRSKSGVAERWDLVAFGYEIGTGYSELNNPLEQRKRFVEQSLLAAGGDAEAMQLDEDFLTALEYGMPPAAGQGMGIDRLLMMLTGKGIRETVLFPFVRPYQ